MKVILAGVSRSGKIGAGSFLLLAALLLFLTAATATAQTGVNAKINFQSQDATVPSGYLEDYGQAYGDRSSGQSYGWVKQSDLSTPTSLVGNGRDRPESNDPLLGTLMHMQLPEGSDGTLKTGAWEIQVPNGAYTVKVAVGDAAGNVDSEHWINIENQNAISSFVPQASGDGRYSTATRTVVVDDGKLTIHARSGTNTKIDYVDISSVAGADGRPNVTTPTPANLATGVDVNTSIVNDLQLPDGGVEPGSVTSDTVQLHRVSDGKAVSANVSTSGGADTLNLDPDSPLAPDTLYRFDVTSGVKDVNGNSFLPFSSVFTTAASDGGGGGGGGGGGDIAFDKVASGANGQQFTSVTKGPDGKLYAGTITGNIYRYDIASDGTLSNEQKITTVRDHANQAGLAGAPDRSVIGLTFDPASTADNLILWITDDYAYLGGSVPDYTGHIAKLTGPDLGTYTDVVKNLPRSIKDHETNSIAFHDGLMYINQGSMNAMGAADSTWGNRSEHLLSASVLTLDYKNLPSSLPVDVKTDSGGNYDPYASGAPLKLYATGVRNAYDLVWHSNGHLYVPTNGSAAGGNTPATPDTMPDSCQNRPDGGYNGPSAEAITNNRQSETDYVFDVKQGKYYGHPNPSRCEWILNAGNPNNYTSDPAFKVNAYPSGQQADPNYDLGGVYNAGLHASANGVIEYKGNAFGGALDGKLVVVRYSANQDLETFDVASGGALSNRTTGITGFTNFNQPLDVTEDNGTGNLYVTELGGTKITLLRPQGSTGNPNIDTTPGRLIFNDVSGGSASASQKITIKNTGSGPLNISNLSLVGDNPGQFQITNEPSLPATVAAGGSATVEIAFDPTSVGPKGATLRIDSDDPDEARKDVNLRGLGTQGIGGSNEPSLQWILDTYEIPVNAGDPDPSDNTMPSTSSPVGEEILASSFTKAEFDRPVSVEPIAVFGPQGPSGNPNVANVRAHDSGTPGTPTQTIFDVPNSSYQSLNPETANVQDFDPSGNFGFDWAWPALNHTTYQEDGQNTWESDSSARHKVRVYPLKDKGGAVVQGAYIVAPEDVQAPGVDYQDVVLIVRNVKPVTAANNSKVELQNLDGVPFNDRLAFSRIQNPVNSDQLVHDTDTVRVKNTGADPLTVNGLQIDGPWEMVDGPTLPATVPTGGQLDLKVKFNATSAGSNGGLYNGALNIRSDASNGPTEVQLSGFWQSQSEGGQEPSVSEIAKVMGWKTDVPSNLNENGSVEAVGDEVLSPYWKRADTTKPVDVTQISAYHSWPSGATFKWVKKDQSTLSSFDINSRSAQSLLPWAPNSTTDIAGKSYTPGVDVFGFKVDGESSDDTKNNQSADESNGCTGPCGHHVRFFPVEDRAGDKLPGQYFMIMDYSGINYDYNDNVYLIKNIRPEKITAPSNVNAVAGDSQVELNWEANTENDLSGYNVYRDTTEQVDTSGTPLNGSPLTDPSYTDKDVTNGTTYHYVVQAVDEGGGKAASDPVSATPVAPSTNTDFKVNFQSEAAPVPSGYFRDFGQGYGARSGADQGNSMAYGWVEPGTHNPLDLTANGRDRNENDDQRLDTLMHMQAGSATYANPFNGTAKDGTWEVSIPDGTYEVTVAAGDASDNSDPESHTINVEGTNAIDNFVPSGPAGSDTHHKTATLNDVNVSDGMLTIDADGGQNSKIDYIDVQEATADTTAPAAPANLAATAGDGKVDLTWNAGTEDDLQGYNVYRSETQQVDKSGTPLNTNPLSNASFTDNTAQNGTTYYYALTAVDGSGNESDASATASATPEAGPAPDTDVKFNFQSQDAPVPSGYLRDFGQPYGERSGADQGSGQSYGWVEPGTSTPLDLTANGRDRDRNGIEQRLDTIIHMQYGDIQPQGSNGTLDPGAWEIAVPDGTYDVTVSVGDQPGDGDVYDSKHSINIEGKNTIDQFQSTAQEEYDKSTVTVDVTDGRLTMDAQGGTNTKPNYVEITGDTAPAENQAPTVTQPDDQNSAEGDDVSLAVDANDPDQDDTLTYEVTGLPGGLSIDSSTGEISGAIASGASINSPFDATVKATDGAGASDSKSFSWTVTAAQAANCAPRSTLDCADVPVGLPYDLTFDGGENGLKDTGFTMVDPPSAPLSQPSNPDVPGYEPSNLDVSGGNLTITSTQGIMYVNPATSTKTNSQVNALGVGIDAAGKTTRIETNATVPEFPSSASSEQGGLWFGLDEDNYAKLVVINTGNGNAKIQLFREIDAVSTGESNGYEVNTANVANNGDAIKLTMVPDAAAGNVTAFYTTGGGQEVELGTLPLPDKFFAGTKINQSSDGTSSFAGVFDTNRRGNTPINMSFKDFSVSSDSQAPVNQAPAVTKPADQNNVEGDQPSLQIQANDPDDGDTLTYSATGLPGGLSIVPNTGEISGTIEQGAAQQDPYPVEVTATDDGQPVKSDTAAFNWSVTAPQPTGCQPYSELECGQVAVGLPYTLGFDATTDLGGLGDKNELGTGFTMVQPTSNGQGYLPQKLDRGSLIITTTDGIQYKSGGTASNNYNTLDNGLGAGFDATKPVQIETTIANPPAGSGKSEQGGLWFGPDEDNYAKLVVMSAGNGDNKIQLLREVNGAVDNDTDELNSDPQQLSDMTVRLSLIADPATNEVTASYTVDGGEKQDLGSFSVPAKFFDGSTLDPKVDGVSGYAGIFATHRTASDANSPLQFTFDDFSVKTYSQPEPNAAPAAKNDSYNVDQGTTLDVNAANGVLSNDTDADQGDTLTAALGDDVQHGNLTLNGNGSFSYVPNDNYSGEDSFTYEVTDADGGSDTATVTITVNAVNAAPVVQAIDDQSVQSGKTKNVDVKATDADANDNIKLSIQGPGFADFTDNGDGTGSIELAPGENAVGDHSITVSASDGNGGTDSKSFKVTVTAQPNAAPQLTKPDDQSATVGQDFSFQIQASDPDQDDLTYEATGLPTGLTIDKTSGKISGTIGQGAAQDSPYTVQLTVSDGTDSAKGSFQLEVKPAPAGDLSAGQQSLGFAQVNVGQEGTKQLTLTNNGNAPTTIQSTDIAGDNPGQFAAPLADPVTVDPGKSTELAVKFAPKSAGDKTATLSIAHDAQGSPLNVQLTGEGTQPAADAPSVTPDKMDFGKVKVGQSKAQELTLKNPDAAGSDPMVVQSAKTSGSQDFSTDFQGRMTIGPGESKTVKVQFAPRETGSKEGKLTLKHDRSGADIVIPLSGTATRGPGGCTIIGTDGDDTLRGTADRDVICGLGGNDKLYGFRGDDLIRGGDGNDRLVGGPGNDRLYGQDGRDFLFGTSGEDYANGGSGNDAIRGNQDNDRLVGAPGNDTVIGGKDDDTTFGGPGTDRLYGQGGDDRLFGITGDDYVNGGSNNDILIGNQDNDRLVGATGNDRVIGGKNDDTMFGGPGRDRLAGQGGDDRLFGISGPDYANGGSGSDLIRGNQGNDRLVGATGNDTVLGSENNDTMFGGPGRDRLFGQEGRDTHILRDGVRGNDSANGGPGRDRGVGDPRDRLVNIP